MHAFDHLIPDARTYLADLSRNNTRDWFAEQKPRYERDLKRPAELLLDAVQPALEQLCGETVRPKLFRINRDLRFTSDKTPYHTHLHMLWEGEGTAPGFLFGIAPDRVTAGAGWMAFSGSRLADWREGVGSPEGAQLQALLRQSKARLSDPELKRVPPPYDADHPRADLLRRKSLVLWRDGLPDGEAPLEDRLIQSFGGLWPALSAVRDLMET